MSAFRGQVDIGSASVWVCAAVGHTATQLRAACDFSRFHRDESGALSQVLQSNSQRCHDWAAPHLEEAMIKKFTSCFAFIASVLSGSVALSDEFGNATQAQALLKRAVGEIQTDKLKAISEFNYNDPRFRDRDLFVFCFNRSD